MRSIFIFTMILFVLTACGTPAAQVTVTLDVTVTPSPAPTETPTVIPSPTESPLPETDAIKEISEAYKADGAGYELGWSETNKDQIALFWTNPEKPEEKVEVTEIVVDPETGEGRRTYMFDNPAGGTAELTVKYTKEQLIARNFSAWEIKDGKWTRKTDTITPADSTTEFKIKPISMIESLQILLSTTEDMPEGISYKLSTLTICQEWT